MWVCVYHQINISILLLLEWYWSGGHTTQVPFILYCDLARKWFCMLG
uniref:Uncharacterized protein n=1 Tax=Rhizophora mucronata TaxID=61149 RepID=A0A2P2QRQ6_RHIMU